MMAEEEMEVVKGGVFWVTMSKATTERDSINSKSAAKQHDLCSLRKYHSTLFTKNREGE